MTDFPTRKITIYHQIDQGFDRYVKEASYRNTSIQNRNKNGESSVDKVLIRIFDDIENYNSEWFLSEGDIIVNRQIEDEIERTPMTILSKKYGPENVHKVISIDKFIFDDEDIKESNHIKIGAV